MNGLLVSFLLGYFPMLLFACFIFWLDRYEKEPLKLLVIIFLWGSVIAAGFAFITNTLLGTALFWLSNSQTFTSISISSVFAPVIEECCKGLIVALIFFFLRSEFDSPLDGIVYGAIVGIGFAATENFYYIYSMGFLDGGLSGILRMAGTRILLVGWQHPFYTAFIGLGFAVARQSRNAWGKYLGPLGGAMMAVMTHAIHNTISPLLIQKEGTLGMVHATIIDWIGWCAIGVLIYFLITQERNRIQQYLQSEVENGTISENQYKYAFDKHKQYSLIHTFRWQHSKTLARKFRTFFQLCAELAHKKRELALYGEEGGNTELVLATRNSVTQLSKALKFYFPEN